MSTFDPFAHVAENEKPPQYSEARNLDYLLEPLSKAEQEQFSRPPSFTHSQREYFFALNDYEKSFIRSGETRARTVYYTLLLGYFKFEPKVLTFSMEEIEEDLEFVKKTMFPMLKGKIGSISTAQKSRIYGDVLAASGFIKFEEKEDEIKKFLVAQAKVDLSKRAIFIALLDRIQNLNCTIPKYYKLSKIVNRVYNDELDRLETTLVKNLAENSKDNLRAMLNDAASPIYISSMKVPIKNYDERHFTSEIEAFQLIAPIIDNLDLSVNKLNISVENILYLAGMVDIDSISKLRRQSFEEVAIYLSCYLVNRFRLMVDRFFDCFVYWVRKIRNDAKTSERKQIADIYANIGKDVERVTSMVDLYVSRNSQDISLITFNEIVFKLVALEDLKVANENLKAINSDQRKLFWEYITSPVISSKVSRYL